MTFTSIENKELRNSCSGTVLVIYKFWTEYKLLTYHHKCEIYLHNPSGISAIEQGSKKLQNVHKKADQFVL